MLEILGFSIPVIYIHLSTLAATAVAILIADKAALSWVRGKRETLSEKRMRLLHYLVGAGLALMILSGAFLLWPLRAFLVTDLAFWTKMAFVLVLVMNSFFIGSLMTLAHRRSFASLAPRERRLVLLSGGVSAIGWAGAFIAALFMTTSDWLLFLVSRFLELF